MKNNLATIAGVLFFISMNTPLRAIDHCLKVVSAVDDIGVDDIGKALSFVSINNSPRGVNERLSPPKASNARSSDSCDYDQALAVFFLKISTLHRYAGIRSGELASALKVDNSFSIKPKAIKSLDIATIYNQNIASFYKQTCTELSPEANIEASDEEILKRTYAWKSITQEIEADSFLTPATRIYARNLKSCFQTIISLHLIIAELKAADQEQDGAQRKIILLKAVILLYMLSDKIQEKHAHPAAVDFATKMRILADAIVRQNKITCDEMDQAQASEEHKELSVESPFSESFANAHAILEQIIALEPSLKDGIVSAIITLNFAQKASYQEQQNTILARTQIIIKNSTKDLTSSSKLSYTSNRVASLVSLCCWHLEDIAANNKI